MKSRMLHRNITSYAAIFTAEACVFETDHQQFARDIPEAKSVSAQRAESSGRRLYA
jgi:hypothetical protein